MIPALRSVTRSCTSTLSWWLAGAVPIVAATLGVSSGMAAPLGYTFTDLGSLGYVGPDHGTWPKAINNKGQVTGVAYTKVNGQVVQQPFLWQQGAIQPLAATPGTGGNSVNDLGQVAGYSGYQAVTWYQGSVTALAPYQGYSGASVAYGISSDGTVVGYVDVSYSSTSGAIWQDGVLSLIPTMRYTLAINGNGQAVGVSGSGLGEQAVLYEKGSSFSMFSGRAVSINNNGVIVGVEYNAASGKGWPTLYDHGVRIHLAEEGRLNFALAVNDSNAVVGRYEPAYNVSHAFLWEEDTFYDLNSIASAGPGSTFVTAEDINNAGQIVGLYINADGNYGGYLLTPVPEPGVLLVLAIGGAVVLMRRPQAGRDPDQRNAALVVATSQAEE